MLERESCPILDGNTVDTLFNGQSGNTLMDTINYERYSILQQKYVKMTAPNKGTKSGYGASGHGTKGGSYLGVEVALGRRLELAVEARVLEEPVARVVGRHRRVVQLLHGAVRTRVTANEDTRHSPTHRRIPKPTVP